VRDLVQHSTTTGTTTLVNHIQYDTFGQLLSQTNPTQTPWFGYTGREWDTATGLTYYRARWYDPRAGRFISEDPLSFAAGDVNLNRYVGNGATLWVDPSGMARQPSQDDMASAMMAPLAWAQANNAVPKGAKHCGNLVFEQVFAHQGWLDYMWGVSPDVLGMVAYDGSDDNAKDLAREIARLMKLKRGLAEIRESVQTGVVAATVLVQIGNEPLDIILSTHEAITNPSWRTIGGALLSTLPLVPGIAGKADDVVDLGKAEDMAKREAASVAPRNIQGQWRNVAESMFDRARAYQQQVTGRTGQSFFVNGVKFDGVGTGVLLDAKGPGYANFVRNGRFRDWYRGADELVDQAQSQLRAANGTPIQWHVAEADAVTAIRNLFADRGITGIDIIHTPVVP
ncbi:MAG: RHS repeat-associated core domain-containing protein, partial [Planctomycetaceae bacterium]